MAAKEKKNMKEVKLQPVSNEEVRRILQEDPLSLAYGCGTGSGSGCGTDSYELRGSVEGEGSYTHDYYEFEVRVKVSYVLDARRSADNFDNETHFDFSYKEVEGEFNFRGGQREVEDSDGNVTIYTSNVTEKNAKEGPKPRPRGYCVSLW